MRGEESANGIADCHDEIRKFRLEQDKVKRDFEKKYTKPVDQEGKLLKRLNKALNKFVNNNVKTLHKGMDDEVTELYNQIQHLFTMEKEKQVHHAKTGRDTAHVFTDKHGYFTSIEEVKKYNDDLLIECQLHECGKGYCSLITKFGKVCDLLICSKGMPRPRTNRPLLVMYLRELL